jgi:hypothetical protein
MPWRGAEVEGEFPTLGYVVADWIESLCVIPDGDHAGEPLRLSEKQALFLLWYYRLHPAAKVREGRPSRAFVYERGGQLVAPQKWGKGPLAAAVTAAEAEGPVVFDGWDADGEPVGRPWSTPWIQVTAVSEAQTANVWRALMPMIAEGPLATVIPDIGETRINLREGGRIERVTASARSRLGQRLTFAVQDEEHDWTPSNGGRNLADTQRRNIAGMGGRWLATGNAWNPTQHSVAQQTYESKTPGVYKMLIDSGPGDLTNPRERKKVLRRGYEGSWWVDLARVESEVIELIGLNDVAQAERFFANRVRQSAAAAYDIKAWRAKASPAKRPVAGSVIVIGVDGARFGDSLAVVATDVATGHQWPLGIWESPPGDDDHEHPLDDVDGVMSDAFDEFKVWRVYVDPQYIEGLLDRWQGRWSDKKVLAWWTNRQKAMAYAVRAHTAAVTAGDLTHDGDPVLDRHIGNAVRQAVNIYDDKRRQMWVITKETPALKIDGATAAVLSYEARGDAIAAGALEATVPLVAFT